jgi:hypothetical protein
MRLANVLSSSIINKRCRLLCPWSEAVSSELTRCWRDTCMKDSSVDLYQTPRLRTPGAVSVLWSKPSSGRAVSSGWSGSGLEHHLVASSAEYSETSLAFIASVGSSCQQPFQTAPVRTVRLTPALRTPGDTGSVPTII